MVTVDADEILAALSAEEREVMSLRLYDRMPFKDIALRLGVSEACAKMRMRRGLDALGAAGLAYDGGTFRDVTPPVGLSESGNFDLSSVA